MPCVKYGILLGMIVAGLFSHNATLIRNVGTTSATTETDGTYEFVSENTVLTGPIKMESSRRAPQWGGLWQFHNGYYSRILMKRKREKFFNSNKIKDLEFEASGGSYKVKGNSIVFMENYTLHPFDVDRSKIAVCQIEGNTLTLVETLHPGVEDTREGSITTIE